MEFFLRRPIFASVASLVILLVGLISIPILPIAQYPNIAPPTVTVEAIYTGASAEAVEASVTTPLEEAINGVQGLRYISSQSGNDGTSQITCVFNIDRGLDQAANDVQNAVNLALGRLPNEVKQIGVTVSKNSGTFVVAMGVTSTDPRWDPTYMTTYLENNVTNDLKRITGVSDVRVFGERKYAMRLWLDPKKLADNALTAGEVTAALQGQNVQVAAGSIGAPPTNGKQPYEYTVRANGRLHDSTQFSNIVLRTTPNGGYVRVKDIGRVTARRRAIRRIAVVRRSPGDRLGRPATAKRQRAAGFAAGSRDDGPSLDADHVERCPVSGAADPDRIARERERGQGSSGHHALQPVPLDRNQRQPGARPWEW